MKIGIIGLGFVGKAISNAYDDWMTGRYIIDIDPEKNNATYEELEVTDAVFVCVPSPMDSDGSCDTGPVHEVIDKLYSMKYKNPVISKVTAPPEFYTNWGKVMPNLVYSPEFLTAQNATIDYARSKYIVLGGTTMAYQREAARVIKDASCGINEAKEVYSSLEEAAMLKYATNAFLAAKVSFMNEIYQTSKQLGINYDKVKDMMILDERIGESHMQVPGPDGEFGFGGMCFPKDVNALLNFSTVEMPILQKVLKRNEQIRGE